MLSSIANSVLPDSRVERWRMRGSNEGIDGRCISEGEAAIMEILKRLSALMWKLAPMAIGPTLPSTTARSSAAKLSCFRRNVPESL